MTTPAPPYRRTRHVGPATPLYRNANSEPLELVVADDDLAFGRGLKVPNQVRRDGLNRH